MTCQQIGEYFTITQTISLGKTTDQVSVCSPLRNIYIDLALLPQTETKNSKETESYKSWILVMQEELNQFQRSMVSDLLSSLMIMKL